MRSFTDSSGRTWELRLSVETLERIAAEAKVDLLDVAGRTVDGSAGGDAAEPPLVRLLWDIRRLIDVVYVAVQPAVGALSRDEFAAVIDGEAAGQMARAFWEELEGFFRPWLPAEADLIAAIRARPAAGPTATPGATSGGSPVSPESTPGP